MAFATIDFHHPQSGRLKQAPVGFSWTTLFFGVFPALFRGHWIGAVIIVLVGFVTFGLSYLVFPFIYNKMYIRYLLGEGFRMSGASADPAYLSKRIGIDLPLDATRTTLSPA